MEVYKSYNLKLDKETYFKLREIQMNYEKNNSKKINKSDLISMIIKKFEQKKEDKKQISILDE
jgi:hypothetical protein